MLKFATHTAHLLSWIPEGQEEVLYLSPQAIMEAGAPIRGGVPVCWPWFGARKNHPSHGIARISEWKQRAENKYTLDTNEAKLTLLVEEENATLTLSLTTQNTTFKTYEITQALHTYFRIGDISKVHIDGHAGHNYHDKVEGNDATQEGPIAFTGDTDRIYLTKEDSTLVDPILNRTITVSKEGSGSTVIWNPGGEKSREIKDLPDDGYRHFCCIEAANTHLDPISIKPTETHTLIQKITVNSLENTIFL